MIVTRETITIRDQRRIMTDNNENTADGQNSIPTKTGKTTIRDEKTEEMIYIERPEEIEEHVRTKIRTVEPEAGSQAWAAQVETIVEEVWEEIEDDDSHHRTIIGEWVRSIARNEADG
jgi:hypothetical protein